MGEHIFSLWTTPKPSSDKLRIMIALGVFMELMVDAYVGMRKK